MITTLLLPNQPVRKTVLRLLILGQALSLLAWWALAKPALIPSPLETAVSLRELFSEGLIEQLMTSLRLYGEALLLSTLLSFVIALSAALAFFAPLAGLWSRFRFLGTVGVPFLLTLYLHSVHSLKLALLTFSISVFMVTGMLDVLAQIPREKYDLARTLRMNEWSVVWEVEVLGRVDVMFDVVRQNAAIGWMMLPMVEGLWKSEGGLGALLDIQNRHFRLSVILAIQLLVLGLGLAQDWLLGYVKATACPYASLLLERR